MFSFLGRVVLVTGGTKGLGREIATAFLEAGADVVVCGRSVPETAPVAGARTASFVPADVRDWESIGSLVETTLGQFGRLDVVVNNAGGSPPADAASASPRFSSAIINLNLIAPLMVSQRANEVMQGQEQGGAIVNITSLSALRPSPGTAAYGAAKAGLVNLTASLAVEFAPKVRLNCVSAGALETDELRSNYGDEYVRAVTATVPMGRMGQPRDVTQACLFLASDAAAFITGANLVVHGGGDSPPAAV
jgi:NAD(P)-dependent dehydrogenase (short-subunit alcohol dehydrogenase family)